MTSFERHSKRNEQFLESVAFCSQIKNEMLKDNLINAFGFIPDYTSTNDVG
jgi:hypothetical protein